MPTPRGLAQRLDQALHRSNLLPRNSRLLLAVSGGADSVALLRLLHTINQSNYWNWTLIVIHIEHGIRGRQSKADAAFVKALARKLKLPFISRSLRLGPHASENTARQARHAAFNALLKQEQASTIVLAHHADDQAETILMNIFRGAGIAGLIGMKPYSSIAALRRPLLQFTRADLRTYLSDIAQPWREDSTNAANHYTRNRLRNQLLPHIKKIYPKASDALSRLGQLATETQLLIVQQSIALYDLAVLAQFPSHFILDAHQLRHANRMVLGQFLRLVLFSLTTSLAASTFERIFQAIDIIRGDAGGLTLQLGNGVSLYKKKEFVLIYTGARPPQIPAALSKTPEQPKLPAHRSRNVPKKKS